MKRHFPPRAHFFCFWLSPSPTTLDICHIQIKPNRYPPPSFVYFSPRLNRLSHDSNLPKTGQSSPDPVNSNASNQSNASRRPFRTA